MATNSQTTTTSTGSVEAYWEITLPLTVGTNTINVEVTDKSGETASAADQVSVNWRQVTTTFDFNPATQTLYGFASNAMVDFNLNSKQQRVHLEPQFPPVSGCLHIASSSYYYLVHANEDHYALYRLKIDNGADAEETFEGYFSKSRDYLRFKSQLVCDSNGDSLYFLVNRRLPSEDTIRSVIYHRSLEKHSSWSTLYETDEASVLVSDFVSGKDALIGYSSFDEKIVSISKSDGAMETLFDNYTTFTMHVAHGSTKEFVYLTTFDGIDRINIAEQSISTIGEVESDNPLHFSQPRSTYLDSVNHRFLIGDSDYHSIISIDQHTGERTIALSNEMGTGPKMVAIRDVVLNEGETYAYVIDDGGNAAEKVLEIDLATGNRRRIGDINSQFNISVAGLELDASNDALYVATNDTVYRIDLSTNGTTTLAISDINQGAVFSSISSIAFDHESETLFISDAVQEQVVALNVNTLETTLISSEFKGDGQTFFNINGLVFHPDTKLLYASNQGHGNVHKVDTETGNRTEIATACAPSFSSGEPADMIMGLSFDSELNELLLVGDRVSRINLNTSTCSYDTYDHQLSVEPLSGSRLLAGTFGALKLIDEETGEVVAISQ
ncbi:YncE family protein [Marinimicrobium locisalis]|uniref:YncE family protein n=1 Tax=Marinimicrobium locisalis TaxID=546022 RepID=UPI003221B214